MRAYLDDVEGDIEDEQQDDDEQDELKQRGAEEVFEQVCVVEHLGHGHVVECDQIDRTVGDAV